MARQELPARTRLTPTSNREPCGADSPRRRRRHSSTISPEAIRKPLLKFALNQSNHDSISILPSNFHVRRPVESLWNPLNNARISAKPTRWSDSTKVVVGCKPNVYCGLPQIAISVLPKCCDYKPLTCFRTFAHPCRGKRRNTKPRNCQANSLSFLAIGTFQNLCGAPGSNEFKPGARPRTNPKSAAASSSPAKAFPEFPGTHNCWHAENATPSSDRAWDFSASCSWRAILC